MSESIITLVRDTKDPYQHCIFCNKNTIIQLSTSMPQKMETQWGKGQRGYKHIATYLRQINQRSSSHLLYEILDTVAKNYLFVASISMVRVQCSVLLTLWWRGRRGGRVLHNIPLFSEAFRFSAVSHLSCMKETGSRIWKVVLTNITL